MGSANGQTISVSAGLRFPRWGKSIAQLEGAAPSALFTAKPSCDGAQPSNGASSKVELQTSISDFRFPISDLRFSFCRRLHGDIILHRSYAGDPGRDGFGAVLFGRRIHVTTQLHGAAEGGHLNFTGVHGGVMDECSFYFRGNRGVVHIFAGAFARRGAGAAGDGRAQDCGAEQNN